MATMLGSGWVGGCDGRDAGEGGGASVAASLEPPVAAERPHRIETHGDVRVDDYFWLRERDNPEVIAYLEAENAYLDSFMADSEGLRTQIFEEIRGRIPQDDSTVPYRDGDWLYYTRYEDGRQYPIYARKRSEDAPEQILLDVNALAEGHEFHAVGGRQVTEDGRILAYGSDTEGRRKYTIRFKDLETGQLLPDVIPDVTSNFVWANDHRTLFYVRQDPETLRAYQLHRHELGTDVSDDVLVYEETDDEFSFGVSKTLSDRYLLAVSRHTVANEYRWLDASRPADSFRVVLPRERGHEYSVAGDVEGDFVIVTNDEAQNFRVVRAPIGDSGRSRWREVVSHRDDVLVEGRPTTTTWNARADPPQARRGRWRLRPEDYVTERLATPARDGTRGARLDRLPARHALGRPEPAAPVRLRLLRLSTDPSSTLPRLSLLDRGFVYAIAHVRGGQELGRRWYEDGKL
jgi:protease II